MNELKDMPGASVPSIWAAQENELTIYKWLSCGLCGLILLLFIFIVVISTRNPLVVIEKKDGHEFHQSARKNPAIENSDIEDFTRNFITALYVWNDLNSDVMSRKVSPYVEPELLQKVIDAQVGRYAKELKGKKLEQDLSFVKVQVLPDRVVCHFDRVLKIEGVPVVIPTDLTLAMIKGASISGNLLGVYIAGITEHEGAK
jgi:hypothetical protein